MISITVFRTVACSQFEYRQTKKEYLAVVEGHIDPSVLPILSQHPEQISLTNAPRHDLKMNKPNHAWQEVAREENLNIHYSLLNDISLSISSDDELKVVSLDAFTNAVDTVARKHNIEALTMTMSDAELSAFMALRRISYEKYSKNCKLRKRLRRMLKLVGLLTTDDVKTIVNHAAASVNAINGAKLIFDSTQGEDFDIGTKDFVESDISISPTLCAYRLEVDTTEV